MEFVPFNKIPRLNREMIVTEKIDGTNGCVVIEEYDYVNNYQPSQADQIFDRQVTVVTINSRHYLVGAQSRSRLITPENDNFGFATWVWENAKPLVESLQVGRHYGEWWGSGIQRNYGLSEKRFSLFNVKRWKDLPFERYGLNNVSTVPVLYEGPFNVDDVNAIVDELRENGSQAAPGFMKPEGVIAYHVPGNLLFKVTCEKDDQPKGQA